MNRIVFWVAAASGVISAVAVSSGFVLLNPSLLQSKESQEELDSL